MEHYSTDSASVDPANEVANLLMEGMTDDKEGEDADVEDPTLDEDPVNDTAADDSDDADELSDESTDGEDDEESEETNDTDSDDDTPLHEMLGVAENQLTVTDDGEFLINVRVDGVESSHPLSDVIKNYQLESSNTNKSKALAKDRKEFERAAEAKAQEIAQVMERNESLAQLLEKELVAEFEAVDWEDLRKYDPAEWSARRQEFGARYEKIKQVQDELTQQKQQIEQEKAAKMAESQQAYLKEQFEKVLDNNPEWKDETVRKGALNDLMATATHFGFSEDEFKMVGDARLFELLKAAKAHIDGAKIAEKKTIKVPKIQKTKGRKRPKVTKLSRLTKAAQNARGANKRQLQTDAVAELLAGT